MAYASNTGYAGRTALAQKAERLIERFQVARQQRKIFRQTLRELSALNNRELADLGMSRSDLRRVAYQAAYEN